MRLTRISAILGLATLIACGSDAPVTPTGPVTVKFITPTYPAFSGGRDTAFATFTFDDITGIAPLDSIMNVARGQHQVTAQLEIEYMKQSFPWIVNPRGSREVIPIGPAPSCRIYEHDQSLCDDRNFFYRAGHRIFCPAGDFGEFCTYFVDGALLGGTWPVTVSGAASNEYIAHAKLLIGGRVGSATGERAAMSLYTVGDYLPRVRHHVKSGDDSYWQSVVWTDARHVPIFPESTPQLPITDRVGVTFGLQVRTTYLLPAGQPDVIFVRWDVTNISDSADYRRLHGDVPAGGRTLYDIYLAPILDTDVGGIRTIAGNTIDERPDDNGTALPADSLVVAYDQEFSVPTFGGGYWTKPGLVGVRMIEGPPGAKALVLDAATLLRYKPVDEEERTYKVLAGGRDGDRAGCVDRTDALICSQTADGEAEHDVRIGWSVGPIDQLAPGETTSLTVAILLAEPNATTFTSGTGVAPVNSDLASTTRAIYPITGNLRTLAAAIKAIRVSGTPF